jgi:lysophospholipase L1-like esterase
MRDTFFDRLTARALRFAFVGGLIGLQSIACSQSKSSDAEEPVGGGGTDLPGSGGDAQPSAGTANPAGTGGNPSAGGSTGSGGATGTAGTVGAGGSSVPIVDAGPRTAPLKIMALGDSVTCCTCFRAELAKLLDVSHPKDYQFVGTINNDFGGCGGYMYDKHNQGMGGYLVTEAKTKTEAPTWAALKPDVVLLHFATNDAWNSIASDKILAAYTMLVTEFRKTNPRVTFIAAQLIPLDPLGGDGGRTCSPCPGNVKSLNAALPAWITATNTPTSRVISADLWTGYVAEVDSCTPGRCDGVHPGPTGSVKMAAKWNEALGPLF